MARPGDNNPRAFGDAVSLDAWRTPFDGETGEADLHVNVVFSEGRIGDSGGPIRFRLEIIRAEVHVLRDAANVLKIKRSTIKSVRLDEADERTVTQVLETEKTAAASLSVSTSPVGQVSGTRKHSARREVVTKDHGDVLSFLAMRTEEGYSFRISAPEGEVLSGTPWIAGESLLTFRDTAHPRTTGEPPELRVELRCRREDLRITSIELTEQGRSYAQLSANQQLAIEQYLKTELLRVGFMVGDISDPFSSVILADVTPEEE